MLFNFYQLMVGILHITDHTHITVRLLSTAALLNIGLNLVLIPRMGIVGAALATVVAYGVLGVLTIFVTRRYLKFDLGLPFIVKSTAASIVMTLFIGLLTPASLGGGASRDTARGDCLFRGTVGIEGVKPRGTRVLPWPCQKLPWPRQTDAAGAVSCPRLRGDYKTGAGWLRTKEAHRVLTVYSVVRSF